MTKQLIKDSLGWGFVLWLVGYILGIILFPFVPPSLIGWIIMPIGVALVVWILTKKVKGKTFVYFLTLSIVWTTIAIVFDYYFLFKAFKPADGYYKLDVYLYYLLTFCLPIIVEWVKKGKKS